MSVQAPNIDFDARFRRYPYELMAKLRRIDRALARIESATLLPAAADQLRFSAKAGTVHYSNLIEGNELPLAEAERAARRELDATTKAKLELVNYVEALDLLDRRASEGGIRVDPDLILEVHGTAMRGLGSEDSHFKPHHEGAWRDGTAVVIDQATGTIMHTGSPAGEVPGRIGGLADWLGARADRLDEFPPPVLAGVAHYGLTDVHPFADGNGRVARLVTAALLMRHGYLPGRLFSFEAYYARDQEAYYAALRSVRSNTLNMETWLDYFLEGLAQEYERVAARVAELDALGRRGYQGPIQLSATQEAALGLLTLEGTREFARMDYERVANVSRAKAARDLKALVVAGVLSPRGKGPASRYRMGAQAPRSPWRDGRGRKRIWTDERIEQELRSFVGDRRDWPTRDEFVAAGRRSLYEAVRRYGGSSTWAELLGVRR